MQNRSRLPPIRERPRVCQFHARGFLFNRTAGIRDFFCSLLRMPARQYMLSTGVDDRCPKLPVGKLPPRSMMWSLNGPAPATHPADNRAAAILLGSWQSVWVDPVQLCEAFVCLVIPAKTFKYATLCGQVSWVQVIHLLGSPYVCKGLLVQA